MPSEGASFAFSAFPLLSLKDSVYQEQSFGVNNAKTIQFEHLKSGMQIDSLLNLSSKKSQSYRMLRYDGSINCGSNYIKESISEHDISV